MTPREIQMMYIALRAHFSSPHYDYVKYCGKIKVSAQTNYNFLKLSKRPDPYGLIVSNLIKLNDCTNAFVGDVCFGPDSDANYHEWKKRQESMQYMFREDLKKIEDLGIHRACSVEDGNYPPLLQMMITNKVSLETVVWLNRLVGFITQWDERIDEKFLWPLLSHKIKKYDRLLPLSINSGLAMKTIAREVLSGTTTTDA